MATDLFVVQVVSEDGDVRLALTGDLDRGVVGTLDRAYREAATTHLAQRMVIDVSALEFCDLGGQRELFRYHAAGARLVGAPACLQRLFALTGHQHVLPATPNGSWLEVSFATSGDPIGEVGNTA